MGKVKKNIKKVICILLAIIFSPVLLIYFLVRKISYNSRKKMWQNNGITGRTLILSTDTDYINLMEDFEIYDYVKYLFFYNGYIVKTNKIGKKYSQFLLIKDNRKILLKYAIFKKKALKNELNYLKIEKNNKKIENAIFLTNLEFDKNDHELYLKDGIDIMDKSKLKLFANETIKKLQLNPIENHISTKSINELLDEKYPNSI